MSFRFPNQLGVAMPSASTPKDFYKCGTLSLLTTLPHLRVGFSKALAGISLAVWCLRPFGRSEVPS